MKKSIWKIATALIYTHNFFPLFFAFFFKSKANLSALRTYGVSIGFGPQFIAEPWLSKCIARFEKLGYLENRKLFQSEREYAKSLAVERDGV